MKTTVKNLIGWVGFIALFFSIAFIAASVLNGYLGVKEDKAWHDNSLVLMQQMKERNKTNEQR